MAVLLYRWVPADAHKPRKKAIESILLHSTDGNMPGCLETLTETRVSAHWLITRAGCLYHMVTDDEIANHAGLVRTAAFSNACSIGIEQEHWDGRETWPEAQIDIAARLIAFLRQKHGAHLPCVSHAFAAWPKGRKSDPVAYPWALLSELYGRYARETWIAQQER